MEVGWRTGIRVVALYSIQREHGFRVCIEVEEGLWFWNTRACGPRIIGSESCARLISGHSSRTSVTHNVMFPIFTLADLNHSQPGTNSLTTWLPGMLDAAGHQRPGGNEKEEFLAVLPVQRVTREIARQYTRWHMDRNQFCHSSP